MKRVGLAVLLLSIGLGQPVWAEDVTGAHDHPMLTRYPQSVIKWYDVQTFMPYKIGVATVGGYRKIDDWVETTGKVTRIIMNCPANARMRTCTRITRRH